MGGPASIERGVLPPRQAAQRVKKPGKGTGTRLGGAPERIVE